MGSRILSKRSIVVGSAVLVLLGGVSGCGRREPLAAPSRATLPEPAAQPVTLRRAVVPVAPVVLPPLPPMGTLVPRGARARAARTSAPGARRGVDVFGDSLTLLSWNYLHDIASARSQPFVGGAYGGTALCDWLPAITRSLRADRPAFLVLAFVGNNVTRCTLGAGGRRQVGAPLVARYRRDASRAIVAARATHTRVFLVGPPAMRESVRDSIAAGLRHALRGLAAHNPNVVYLGARSVLSPAGFRLRRPCLAFETPALACRGGTIAVRAIDSVHLAPPLGGYSSGDWRYAKLLLHGVPNAS
jgi:hypothetical protein